MVADLIVLNRLRILDKRYGILFRTTDRGKSLGECLYLLLQIVHSASGAR